MENLVIRLFSASKAVDTFDVQWALFNNQNMRVAGSESATFEEMSAHLPERGEEGRDVIVIVPGAEILLTAVTIPPKQKRFASKIVPFLVEEQLAEDTSHLHVAMAAQVNATDRVLLAVVRKDLMQKWCDAVAQMGLNIDIMVAETLTLTAPHREGEAIAISDGVDVWLRVGALRGLTTEHQMFPTVIEILAKEKNSLDTLKCLVADPNVRPALLDDWEQVQKRHPGIRTTVVVLKKSVFEIMAENCIQMRERLNALNLMQGVYAPRRTPKTQEQKIWRKIVKGAMIALTLVLISEVVQVAFLSYRLNRLHAQINALYSQIFPEDKKIINPVQQMRSHLNVANAAPGNDFLSLIARVAAQTSGEDLMDVQSLSFSDEQHVLTMSFNSKSLAAVNELALKTNHGMLSSKLLSVTNDKEEVRAQLAIKEVGP